MLVLETIAKIQRAYFQDKKSIKQICRELRVSRNTVRKVIRSGATALIYERTIQPLPKIGPWTGELDDMLAAKARKAKRDRLTLIRIEGCQFDWSHEIVVIDGATTTVKVAHVRLCHSRMLFVRAYPRETQECEQACKIDPVAG